MNIIDIVKQLDGTHGAVGGLAMMAGAYCRPQLEAALKALPNYLARRAKSVFDADVASGKIPPAVARLARKLKRAVVEWADEELPHSLDADKLAAALEDLERLPYIGTLVRADPAGVQQELAAEYAAMRAEVTAEDAPPVPPIAAPNPAAANVVPAP